jgi:hypothetical protein
MGSLSAAAIDAGQFCLVAAFKGFDPVIKTFFIFAMRLPRHTARKVESGGLCRDIREL